MLRARTRKALAAPKRAVHKLCRMLHMTRLSSDGDGDASTIESTPAASINKASDSTSAPAKNTKVKLTQKSAATPAPPLEECTICHDPIGVPNPENVVEHWVELHCGHRFGNECIQTWLQDSFERDPTQQPTCPFCRGDAKQPGCGHYVYHDAYRLLVIRMREAEDQGPEQPSPSRSSRRRLQRREGHPLQQSLLHPPIVGQCRPCEATKAMVEKARRKQQAREAQRQSQIQRQSQFQRQSGLASVAAELKSMLPRVHLRRTEHGFRTTFYTGRHVLHVQDSNGRDTIVQNRDNHVRIPFGNGTRSTFGNRRARSQTTASAQRAPAARSTRELYEENQREISELMTGTASVCENR